MKIYTGVGSRETPANVQAVMTSLAKKLASEGWALRSGGAQGADSAFERGATAKRIYRAGDANDAALKMAAEIHPAWHRCPPFAKKLHARNCFQVLGPALDSPSTFLVCWTRGGAKQGGTATAISLAEKHGVPVFNLALPEVMERIKKYIG